MRVTLLFHEAIVACCQVTTRLFAVEHHRNDEQRDTQIDERAGNEHILETIALDPGRNCKWDSNADDITEEGYSREGVTGNQLKANG
ncbi:hypothetical protein N7534_007956 [Penicillium rubens]|nr:hypothetical protein N7534_007956 [Penicillium rubens]